VRRLRQEHHPGMGADIAQTATSSIGRGLSASECEPPGGLVPTDVVEWADFALAGRRPARAAKEYSGPMSSVGAPDCSRRHVAWQLNDRTL
jgi:hypothetical protein